MINNIENAVLDAIDILIKNSVDSLAFDKTIRAKVLECLDESLGKYQVRYQDSTFVAYAQDIKKKYNRGAEVYVILHSSDFEKDASILGTVSKTGADFLNIIPEENKYSVLGNNIIKQQKEKGLCSYFPNSVLSENLLTNDVQIDDRGKELYKEKAKYFLFGASFKTKLPLEQQVGNGDYGLILKCKYYNSKYKNHAEAMTAADGFITRDYVINIDRMTGRPYQFSTKERQYLIFELDGKNLESIVSLQFFCKGFPHSYGYEGGLGYVFEEKLYAEEEHITPIAVKPNTLYKNILSDSYWGIFNDKFVDMTDIFMSDVELKFLKELTEQEIQGNFLGVNGENGNYFTSPDEKKRLVTTIRIDGQEVDSRQQKVQFFWFKKNTSISIGDVGYSSRGGAGWECLNPLSDSGYAPLPEYFDVTSADCPSKNTTFKAVALFNKNNKIVETSAEVDIINDFAGVGYAIISSMGASFAFNLGKTTLTVTPQEDNTTYKWARVLDDGILDFLPFVNASIEVDVSQFLKQARYEVAIFKSDIHCGNASILLENNSEISDYKIVLNNRTQVFKYNAQGIAPNSISIEEDARIKNPSPLSFDIYDDLGRKVVLSNEEKSKICEIKWIWCGNQPTSVLSDNTMIVTDYTYESEEILNPAGNNTVQRYILKNTPVFEYNIFNRFDAERTSNEIKLEVIYKGKTLTEKTDFTFTKEGEIGTNGTKYVARIIPKDAAVDKIFILNNLLRGYKVQTDGSLDFRSPHVSALKAQIWGGDTTPVYDQVNGPFLDGHIKLDWSVVNSGRVNSYHKLSIDGNGYINISPGEMECASTIQVGISTNTLLQDVKTYYAGYPVNVSYSPDNSTPLVTKGYNHCMFESDGTRSTFNPHPFVFKLYDFLGKEVPIAGNEVKWQDSWSGQIKWGQEATILPPDKYDGTNLNNFIKVQYRQYKVIISVDFYLNRYGLSALNSWDGNSIKINQQGNKYILAPQIGAGHKENDNSFTGITLGKSMDESSGQKNEGLFGYHRGERSIFLDAHTGDAFFGISGKNQIQIKPSDGTANIQSGNYVFNSNNHAGTGMLIDFSTPRIIFGSDRFNVSPDGSIHAAGGGDIAGWRITDTELASKNNSLHLISEGEGIFYSNSHNALGNRSTGFYLSSNGLSIGSSIEVDSSAGGAVRVGRLSGQRHWIINGDNNESYIGYNATGFDASNLGSSTDYNIGGLGSSVYLGTNGIRLGQKFAVDREGNLVARNLIARGGGSIGGWSIDRNALTADGIEINSRGSISVDAGGNNSWSIESNGNATFNNLIANGKGSIAGWQISSNELSADGIRIKSSGSIEAHYGAGSGWKIQSDGRAYFNSGKIGGWEIGSDRLTGGQMYLSSNGAVGGTGWSISSGGEANFSHVTAANIFSFGAGVNKWTNAGFTFGNGSLGGNTVTASAFNHAAGEVQLGGTRLNSSGSFLTGNRTSVDGKALPTYIKDLVVGTLNVQEGLTFQGKTVKWQSVRIVQDVKLSQKKKTFSYIKRVDGGGSPEDDIHAEHESIEVVVPGGSIKTKKSTLFVMAYYDPVQDFVDGVLDWITV